MGSLSFLPLQCFFGAPKFLGEFISFRVCGDNSKLNALAAIPLYISRAHRSLLLWFPKTLKTQPVQNWFQYLTLQSPSSWPFPTKRTTKHQNTKHLCSTIWVDQAQILMSSSLLTLRLKSNQPSRHTDSLLNLKFISFSSMYCSFLWFRPLLSKLTEWYFSVL